MGPQHAGLRLPPAAFLWPLLPLALLHWAAPSTSHLPPGCGPAHWSFPPHPPPGPFFSSSSHTYTSGLNLTPVFLSLLYTLNALVDLRDMRFQIPDLSVKGLHNVTSNQWIPRPVPFSPPTHPDSPRRLPTLGPPDPTHLRALILRDSSEGHSTCAHLP